MHTFEYTHTCTGCFLKYDLQSLGQTLGLEIEHFAAVVGDTKQVKRTHVAHHNTRQRSMGMALKAQLSSVACSVLAQGTIARRPGSRHHCSSWKSGARESWHAAYPSLQ